MNEANGNQKEIVGVAEGMGIWMEKNGHSLVSNPVAWH
jgi:hypothetical protein